MQNALVWQHLCAAIVALIALHLCNSCSPCLHVTKLQAPLCCTPLNMPCLAAPPACPPAAAAITLLSLNVACLVAYFIM